MHPLLRRVAGLTGAAIVAALLPIVAETPAGAIPVPPANDPIASAIALVSGVGVTTDNTGATKETNERGPGNATSGGVDPDAVHCVGSGASTWYKLPAGVSRVSLHVSPIPTADLGIGIWETDTASPTADAATHSTGKGALRASYTNEQDLSANLNPAKAHFVQVDACNPTSQVTTPPEDLGSVSFTATMFSPPANDAYGAATDISGTPASTGDNTGATAEANENHCYATGQNTYSHAEKSVWYFWTAPSSGQFIFDTAGSTFNTVLCVGTRAAAVAGWSAPSAQISDDVSASDLTSRVQVAVTAGAQYAIKVDGTDDLSHAKFGTFALHWTKVDSTPPIVTITSPAPAANVAPNTTQTINATVTDVDSGVASVTIGIDGVGSKVLPAVSGNQYSAQIPLTNVTPGTYTVRVSATDHANNVAPSKTQIINIVPNGYTGATPGTGVTPVKNPGVKGTGTSVVAVKPLGISKGTKGVSAAHKGSKITIHFVGHKLALHFVSFKRAGIVKITIDGKASTFNLFRATTAKDIVKLLTSPRGGLHTVTVTVISKSPASLGYSAVLWLIGIGK